jgi:hypothetical protein
MGSLWRAGCAGVVISAVFFATTASAAFSNQPDTTWMTNGFVRAVIRAGDRIYIGGHFTSVRPCAPNASCADSLAVNNVAAFDADTGVAIPSFRPAVTGGAATVYALAVLEGKLFIGGKFTTVEGAARRNFAAVDAVTGALDPAVDAQVGTKANHYVRALLAHGDRVYAGGVFLSVDGMTRIRLAAFDASGNLDPLWRPRADSVVTSFALACDGETLFVGGHFRRAAGSGRSYVVRETIARFDLVSGNLHNWQPVLGSIPDELYAYDIAPTCERIFVGYAGFNWAYALDLGDDFGDVLWWIRSSGDFQTVALYGDRVLLGGHFTEIDPTNGSWVDRTRFAVVDFDGGLDSSWTPSFSGRYLGPWDILVDGNRVWIGGDFRNVSGEAQRGLARFTDTP